MAIVADTRSDAAEESDDRRSKLPGAASVVGGTALIAAHAAVYGSWLVDDAAVTFTYARNIAEGHGAVQQPGDPAVEGYSNPAWLGLLTVGRLLGLFDRGSLLGLPDYVLFPKALALLCCAGVLVGFQMVASRLVRRAWLVTLAAGVVLAAIPSFVIWSFSGLENSLYALIVTWIAVVAACARLSGRLLTRHTAVTLGLLALAAALARPDGLIYVLAYPLVLAVATRGYRTDRTAAIRAAALSTAAFAVPFAAFIAWRYAVFGQFLANTATAKSQGLPGLGDLAGIARLFRYPGWPAVLLAVAAAVVVLRQPSRFREGLSVLLVPLGLAMLAYGVLADDWMVQYRFATPVWPLGALAATLAVARALQRVKPRVQQGAAVLLIGGLLLSAYDLRGASMRFTGSPTTPLCAVADRSRLVNGYADLLGLSQGSLLSPDMGGSSLTSRLKLYDLAGLTDRRIAGFWQRSDMAAFRSYIFTDLHPTFIDLSRDAWRRKLDLAGDPRLARDYLSITSGDGPTNYFVRKDAVPGGSGPAALAAVNRYASAAGLRIQRRYEDAGRPLSGCGPVLRPGQTPAL